MSSSFAVGVDRAPQLKRFLAPFATEPRGCVSRERPALSRPWEGVNAVYVRPVRFSCCAGVALIGMGIN